MLKIIDTICEKSCKRVDEGKATKIDTVIHNWAKKSVQKHPKFWKFITDHEEAVDIVLDVAMTASLINLGYQFGKLKVIKDFNKPLIDTATGFKLADNGKDLIIANSSLHPGLKVDTIVKVKEPSDLLKIANSSIEALKNRGVEFHTI